MWFLLFLIWITCFSGLKWVWSGIFVYCLAAIQSTTNVFSVWTVRWQCNSFYKHFTFLIACYMYVHCKREAEGWKANKRPKSAKIIEQSAWWMIHMKVICGRANVQRASISERGKLRSRQSLVNDEVLIGFQCLRVPLDTEWSVCTES